MSKKWSEAVLSYSRSPGRPAARATIRRHYRAWRVAHGLPDRCDIQACIFHTQPLVWNGAPLPFIVDHAHGNTNDNRPKALRMLCPNCNEQLETRGGANKGRVVETSGGYQRTDKGGKRHIRTIAESGHIAISGGSAHLTITKPDE